MGSNLRNKQFHIRNKQYGKDEYFREMEKLNLGSRAARGQLLGEFQELQKKTIYRFANIINAPGSTGNNISNAKNCKNCFDVYDAEDIKYSFRTFISKDCMDYDFGGWSELMYEYITGARNGYNVKFSYSAMGQDKNAEYIDSCINCTDIFGCIGLKNKQNSILNKTYPKEEYITLRQKIIKHMAEMPYIDEGGLIYKYGEFFPFNFSPFAYNESLSQEYSPLTKEQILNKGYHYKKEEIRNYTITLKIQDIPDSIKDVGDEIFSETLECSHCGNCDHHCSTAFRITLGELQFYRKHNIPLPDKCPNCRYFERFAILPKPSLYRRQCMCGSINSPQTTREHFHGAGKCKEEFETSYTPERPEIVYCEQCYNQEIY